jgi:hypothetical protein
MCGVDHGSEISSRIKYYMAHEFSETLHFTFILPK